MDDQIVLLAAAASSDITPVTPMPLAGFASRTLPFERISSPLELNALAVRGADGRCAVVLSVDALFVGRRLQEEMTVRFQTRHGQRADDLIIVASHTHSAPSLDATKPRLGAVDPAHLSSVIERCSVLLDKVVTEARTPAHIERRCGVSNAGINRRREWRLPHLAQRKLVGREAVMAPNPDGPIDRAVTVWTVNDPHGVPLAVLWNFACHPTGYPQELDVSADFPGVVRAKLRARLGASLPVLFLQGFAGDIRPDVPERRSRIRRLARAMVLGPSFDGFDLKGWQKWADSLADDVEGILSSATTVDEPAGEVEGRAEAAAVASASSSLPLSMLVLGEANDRLVHLRRLRIGRTIDIVAVAAEPLSRLRGLIPFGQAASVGYLGDVFGYWPADADQALGGYEVSYFAKPFGLAGTLRKNLDRSFRKAVAYLARVN